MSVIEWNDSYAVGLPEIDEHHRHLLSLFDKTYQLFLEKKHRSELEEVIDELINYATYHFAVEERLMAEYRYPQRSAHQQLHASFIDRITTQQLDFYSGRTTLALELVVMLRDWILNHILEADRAFAVQIHACEPAPAEETESNQAVGVVITL
ncbi:hypothetical protein GMST_27410 [Geomonas silvestris]|uniref:Hemerythrin-like domain-containing protein n=1 Tax=Geomonas silvestris TaxID=2740184 RepID=A0A6V8MKB3_9BACT|nr:bacteriohemerythrin [Geomonas silvestris]GFO60416.1 hypothetical protein GMST_27410 [Geomonas silvestris]